MHNCRRTKKAMVEMALTRPDQSGTDDFDSCPACSEEFAALRSAARATRASMQLAQPAENFWPGYRERLRERLQQQHLTVANGWLPPPPTTSAASRLRKLLLTSIRVPVPVAAAALILIAVSIFFAASARQTSHAETILTPPSVTTRQVEVPVIREKLVTRVVYRTAPEPGRLGGIAKAPDSRREESTTSGLAGFKPANEAKLTIINGSYRDEK